MTSQEEASFTDLTGHVRDALVDAAPAPGQVTDAAAKACYGYLISALEGAEDPAAAIRAAVLGVMEGGKKLLAPFWHCARGAMIGTIHAAVGQRLDVESVIGPATVAAMDGADAVGGDFGAAAQGCVEGAIEAANELALSDEALGSRAAAAALKRSMEMVDGAHEKVHHLVTRRVRGVTINVPTHLRLD